MIIGNTDDGSTVFLPFDFSFAKTVRGRLANEVLLTIDARDFDRLYGRYSIWCQGSGPYAVLAYCGNELTISRWSSLAEAVTAKQQIDGSSCGGSCAKVHLIIFCDPENPEHTAARQRIEAYAREHPEAVRKGRSTS